ncbi:MAG: DUF3050 domain-containing protein [Lentisphaerales bacterium]|nr:DUF3050 domain-containing protein [Lentisphaerales bacterium]
MSFVIHQKKTSEEAFSFEDFKNYQSTLNRHPLFGKLLSLKDIKIFMTHHVYCVWDFMSLLKSLQNFLTPCKIPWIPSNDAVSQRLINEIVLDEETDQLPDGTTSSHFNLYLRAMKEIGLDTSQVKTFLDSIDSNGLYHSLKIAPEISRIFMEKTFSLIKPDAPHVVAAAFCVGRESIIPSIFSRILNQKELSNLDVPLFKYYLSRHLEVDEEKHGPMALTLLNSLCTDETKILEAKSAADIAINARIDFLDALEKLL